MIPSSPRAAEGGETFPPLLALRGIRKSFGGVEVLHGVDLTLHQGEVLALLGENGAGKSTLMNILSGDYSRDAGAIQLEGRSVEIRSPRDAEAHGIRLIHQELSYAPDLSVAENVLMGRLPVRSGPLGSLLSVVDGAAVIRQATEALALLKADIDPRQLVGRLSVGERQIVEIARALSGSARLLIFDEPTAALNARETRSLFETIEMLRSQGVGMIYISHRLDEVEEIAQRVTVLRDGNVAGDAVVAEVSRRDIVRMMVGREVESRRGGAAGIPGTAGPPALEVNGLTRRGCFEEISFSVQAGEVVGLYGLLGAGQSEVVHALFGAEPADSGMVRIGGESVRLRSPQQARHAGIGLVPDDRKTDGLVLGMSVGANMGLGNWKSIAHNGVLQPRRERECAAKWMERLRVRAPGGASQVIGTLSGGNQQKVVLARWLEAGTRVLLLAEPTRGVDVGARADIYAVLGELQAKGLALVVVSTDQEEMSELCDRTLVFARGRVVATLDRAQTSREALLSAAAGGGAEVSI